MATATALAVLVAALWMLPAVAGQDDVGDANDAVKDGAAAEATVHPGVTLVPISYHPYPDDADPLGIPYYTFGDRSFDYFVGTYAFLDQDRNGFDFPSVVVDGHVLLEGTFGGTYEDTLAAYRGGFDSRSGLETPLALTVRSEGEGLHRALHIQVDAPALEDESRLRLHWAVTEDDVHFRPPAALSNGVFVHRFTARDISPLPLQPVVLDDQGRFATNVTLTLDPDWDPEKLAVAVWVQNHAASGSRFQTMEVLQATLHPLAIPGTTIQQQRAVMLEMYTATWCATCLFGDHALDTLATEHGLASSDYQEPQWRYLRSPQWATLGMGVLGGLAVALVALRPPRGGTPA